MIRKILCKDCALENRGKFPGDQLSPGVKLEFDVGLSQTFLKCDDCGCKNGIGCVAVAMTMWNLNSDDDFSQLGWYLGHITPTEYFEPEKMFPFLGGSPWSIDETKTT